MKRYAAWLLVLSLLFSCAYAQGGDDCFTSKEDLYYHFNERCLGLEERVPISAEAAEAFDKGICPVCMPAEPGEAVHAVSRGGTIAVRFSDAWLSEHELTGVFGFMGQSEYSGMEAHQILSRYLHGEEYNAFMQNLMENGSAAGRANLPVILPAGDARILSSRHIGADWYIILRPGEKFANPWYMYWRVESYAIQMEGDTLYSEFDLQTVEDYYPLQLESMNDSRPVYTRENERIAIEVYDALEGNIAVIREKDAGADMLENVRLVIGGRDDGIALSGYMDGKDAIYCCMLTGAELEQLRGNARAELWHTEQVNRNIFRVNGADAFDYYSETTGKLLFTIDKADGHDPVDDDFRMVFSGEPDCFVVDTTIYRYLKSGRETISVQGGTTAQVCERITPLFWYGEGGVFLVESNDHADYASNERLFEQNIVFEERFGSRPEDEWGSYLCWLVDEKGEVINTFQNQAFTLHKDGSVTFETLEGDHWTFNPPSVSAGD